MNTLQTAVVKAGMQLLVGFLTGGVHHAAYLAPFKAEVRLRENRNHTLKGTGMAGWNVGGRKGGLFTNLIFHRFCFQSHICNFVLDLATQTPKKIVD
jgi:hypothetical protein